MAASMTIAFAPAALAGEASDPQGDTINDETDKPMDVPEADIVKSWMTTGATTVVLGLQVRKPTDPGTHRAWVDGDSSAEWDLDVNGDSKPDFTVSLSNEDGKVVGGVSRFDATDDNDDPDDVCPVTRHGYAADTGYTATVDLACIGSPSSVAYQAEFFFDTDPNDDEAPEATDSSPDNSMSPQSSPGRGRGSECSPNPVPFDWRPDSGSPRPRSWCGCSPVWALPTPAPLSVA